MFTLMRRRAIRNTTDPTFKVKVTLGGQGLKWSIIRYIFVRSITFLLIKGFWNCLPQMLTIIRQRVMLNTQTLPQRLRSHFMSMPNMVSYRIWFQIIPKQIKCHLRIANIPCLVQKIRNGHEIYPVTDHTLHWFCICHILWFLNGDLNYTKIFLFAQ
jgi:hypothetical protein